MFAPDSYEIKCITETVNSRVVEAYPHVLLEFANPKEAFLFGLYNSFNYIPIENGLFSFKYNDYRFGFNLLQRYKGRIKDRKYVCVIDRNERSNLRNRKSITDILDEFRESGYDPGEMICVSTGGGEGLFDFLGELYLRDLGYIVFPQSYGLHNFISTGVPDNIAVKLEDFQNAFIENNVIEYGALLSEFELFNVFDVNSSSERINERLTAVIESKDIRADWGQLEGYLNSSYFIEGYMCKPATPYDRENPEKPYSVFQRERREGRGEITWRPNGKPYIILDTKKWGSEKKVEELIRLTKRYILLTYLKAMKIPFLKKLDYSLPMLIEKIIQNEINLNKIFR